MTANYLKHQSCNSPAVHKQIYTFIVWLLIDHIYGQHGLTRHSLGAHLWAHFICTRKIHEDVELTLEESVTAWRRLLNVNVAERAWEMTVIPGCHPGMWILSLVAAILTVMMMSLLLWTIFWRSKTQTSKQLKASIIIANVKAHKSTLQVLKQWPHEMLSMS